MSNCVVRSRGSRLPRSIVADHGIEGGDHLSHNGDDNDFWLLFGRGETVVEPARPGHHALVSGYGQRCATFRDEDVWGRWSLTQELAQRAAFPRRYRMHAGIPA